MGRCGHRWWIRSKSHNLRLFSVRMSTLDRWSRTVFNRKIYICVYTIFIDFSSFFVASFHNIVRYSTTGTFESEPQVLHQNCSAQKFCGIIFPMMKSLVSSTIIVFDVVTCFTWFNCFDCQCCFSTNSSVVSSTRILKCVVCVYGGIWIFGSTVLIEISFLFTRLLN